jgi:hypothetical protein
MGVEYGSDAAYSLPNGQYIEVYEVLFARLANISIFYVTLSTKLG